APHDAPFILARNAALLEEIVEAAGAQHVDTLSIDLGPLADRHLGLRDGALSLDVDAGAAQEMQDGNAVLKAAAADFDELRRRALEPGGRHPAVVMPYGCKALPETGVAPYCPVLYDFGNLQPVLKLLVHVASFLVHV